MGLKTVFRFRRRQSRATLTHEQAMRQLVDYHFGRLPREQEIEVEAHLRVCSRCASEGLRHEPAAKRAARRRLEAVRPRRVRRSGRRLAVVALLIAIVLAAVLGGLVYAGSLPTVLGMLGHRAGAADRRSHAAPPSATPSVLTSRFQFGQPPERVAAVAASPDGRLVAVSCARAGKPGIEIWRVRTRARLAVLAWAGNALPGAVAWSPDGAALAAADQGLIGVWDVPSDADSRQTAALRWAAGLPQGRSARVFATRTGSSRDLADAERTLDQGRFLLWGPDGSLSPATQGEAPYGVAAPGGPLVGFWQEQGTHIFVAADGVLRLGISPSDVVGQLSVLQWAPDGRHLFWTNLTSRLSAPDAADSAVEQIATPNAIASVALRRLAHDGAGDVYAWFSPDARLVAMCAPRTAGAELRVLDVATGHVVATHPTLCAHLDASLAMWLPSSQSLVVAPWHAPVAVFSVAASAD